MFLNAIRLTASTVFIGGAPIIFLSTLHGPCYAVTGVITERDPSHMGQFPKRHIKAVEAVVSPRSSIAPIGNGPTTGRRHNSTKSAWHLGSGDHPPFRWYLIPPVIIRLAKAC